MQKHVIILLADGVEEIEAVVPIDLLRRAGINVTTLGVTEIEVCGSHAIGIQADMLLSEFPGIADALILPGGPGHKNLLASDAVIRLVQQHHNNGRLCAAICAGPTVLAQAGILNNKKATCFPGLEHKLDGAIVTDSPVVIDETIITARAAGTAVDFSLAIIEYLAGNNVAQTVSSAIVYER